MKKNCERIAILTLYVDDIISAVNHIDMLAEIKMWLFGTLEMKDLDEASYIMGIKIERDRKMRRLSLSQQNYIEGLSKKYQVVDCLSGRIPYNNLRPLSKVNGSKNMK